MKIKLKNEKEFNVTNVSETKGAGLWFLNFVITDSISSDYVDNNFTADNFSEIRLISDGSETLLTGYSKIVRVTIAYNGKTSSASVQLSKLTGSEVSENES